MTTTTTNPTTSDLSQAIHVRMAEFTREPLLANGGRVVNILDPDTFGWKNVQRMAERDGVIALTMVDRDATLASLASTFPDIPAPPFWDAFTGAPDHVLPECAQVLAGLELRTGWRITHHTAPDDATIRDIKALHGTVGIATLPRYYLLGEHVPSLATCLQDETGRLIACACASMRFHPESPLAGWLFAGAVAVDPAFRRLGLGSLVNAALLREAHAQFGWHMALEQAKAENAASVGMITRCGLLHDPDRVSFVIDLTGGFATR